jgi:hypothetical protein
MVKRFQLALCMILFLIGCTYDYVGLPVLSDKFSDIQKQTFNKSCAYSGCHDSSQMPGALLSLVADSAYNQLLYTHPIQNSVGAAKYKALVVPGSPDSSFLVEKLVDPLLSPDSLEGDRMPSRKNVLPQNEIDAIISWIRRGAPND